jgi:uncharacterized protein with von Willebrand factor type A (vWA) domain
MGRRFTYSQWDGTQQGFDLDADLLFEQLGDDLLYHGDPASALRRMMQDGLRDVNGEHIEGVREMMRRLRERREEIRESGDLGGVYSEIAEALDDVVDEERLEIEKQLRSARESGDERRAEAAEKSTERRNFQLDMLPDDLAGKVAELQRYDFQSREASRRFDELMDKLREQVMQQHLDQMSSAIQNMDPEQLARTKDMLAALNEMIERRANGEDPGFEKFMDAFGDFFPENPRDLDELLELMANRMAQAQAMLNSMTPAQREQLQQLSDQLLEDMDLRWQMSRLGESLRGMFPDAGWEGSQEFSGTTPLGFQEAMEAMRDIQDIESLEAMLKNASTPAGLAEVDLDRVHDLLGGDAAKSLERLSELTELMQEAGLIDNKEGRLTLSPRAIRKLGANALRDLFGSLRKDMVGQHVIDQTGFGHERAEESRPYEFGDPFRLDLHGTLRNAIRRNGAQVPITLAPEDFEIERTEHSTRSSTVLMLDLSMSMPMRDNFLPAKKVAIALHHLISSQFPRDYLGVVGFGETARELRPESLPEASWDFAYGTNMHHAFTLARRMLAHETGTKQIIMITDGEPTAHITARGDVYFNYPPVYETVELTLREVVRCTKAGIRINTFMLDADNGLRRFVEQMSRINRGRAFFTTHDTLGDYVLIDFLEHKRQMSRGSGSRGRRSVVD